MKLHKFDPKWRKAQIFYVLVLIQVAVRSACLLVLASKLQDLSTTITYLLISTPDSLFLISYILLIWQLVSLYYFAHISNKSSKTFIAKISQKAKSNKTACILYCFVLLFAISQGFLYFLLVIEQILPIVIASELDWLNIGFPSCSLIILLVLSIQYSGVPLKSVGWKKKMQQFIRVSVYWTITRFFRGLSSLVGNLSDLNLTADLENSKEKTADYIMLIVVLIISEILCVYSVLDFGFMGIFIFSEEESENSAPILRKETHSDSSSITISNTTILISEMSESPIISLTDIVEGEEVKTRKNSLGKIYQARFKNSSVLFRKITLQRLSGYIIEELTSEIEVHRSLNFSHVLPIIGIVIELPVIGFVTPLMAKGSLYEALHVNKLKLTMTEKIRIASDIAVGVLNFHSQGKAHGHLTSHNILLDDNLVPFISDLGFQKLKKYAGIVSGYTNISAWSSPELIMDKRLTPIKAQISDDSYSFGMIAWELLSEHEPFPDFTRKQLINSVAELGNRPVIPSNTPEDVAEVILRCWNPEAKSRPIFSEIFNVLNSYSAL